MAKKINVAVVKEFLFNHGEKVALGTCAFVALFFGVMGLLRAMHAGKPDGSNKTWPEAFQVEQVRINDSLGKAEAIVLSSSVQEKMKPKFYVWDPVISDYVSFPYAIQGEPNTSKRINPQVLAIDANQIQLDYLPVLVYVHEVQGNSMTVLKPKNAPDEKPLPPEKGKGKKDPPPPVKQYPPVMKGVPTRMVVVTAVFPMRKQVEEFQQALRMSSQREMFTTQKDDRPRVLGINVVKYEIVNKKRVDEKGEVLLGVQWNSKDKNLTKGKALDDLLRIAFYDEETPELLKEHIWAGLTTPWPKLGNAQYPKFKFEGFEIDFPEAMPKRDVADAGKKPVGEIDLRLPPKGGIRDRIKPPGEEMKPGRTDHVEDKMKVVDVRTAYPLLAARLFPVEPKEGDPKSVSPYNIFHVLGYDSAAKNLPEKMPRPGPGEMPGRVGRPGKEQLGGDRFFSAWEINPPKEEEAVPPEGKKIEELAKAAYPKWDRDALVRFVDPGAVPGKTYEYDIQVRMANPNFGKDAAEIAFADLARFEELPPSDWVTTKPITIPSEYRLYAIDEQPAPDPTLSVEPKKTVPKFDPLFVRDYATFQAHQWIDYAKNPDANGIKLVIGDWAIGERIPVQRGETIGHQVLVKVPNWQRINESFEMRTFKDPPNSAKYVTKPGFKMDFKSEAERPILIDFTGGKRLKGDRTIEEESAVDALVLSEDGKLLLLNSRIAMEGVEPADVAEALLRQARVDRARERVRMYAPAAIIPPFNPKGGKGGN